MQYSKIEKLIFRLPSLKIKINFTKTLTLITCLLKKDLSNNQITTLPGGIGFLVRLTELYCSYNQINALPDDFVNMRCKL